MRKTSDLCYKMHVPIRWCNHCMKWISA
jgi:hypothetical protein